MSCAVSHFLIVDPKHNEVSLHQLRHILSLSLGTRAADVVDVVSILSVFLQRVITSTSYRSVQEAVLSCPEPSRGDDGDVDIGFSK